MTEYTPQQWANYWKKKYNEQAKRFPFCIVQEHWENDAGIMSEKYYMDHTEKVKEKSHQDKTGSSYDTYSFTRIIACFWNEEEMIECYKTIFENKNNSF